jgi:curli biogenesis system outer membrane secretion channel CsgG
MTSSVLSSIAVALACSLSVAPNARAQQPRSSITIAAFDTSRTGWVPPPNFGETVSDLLTARLVETGAFRVFDRTLLPPAGPAGRPVALEAIREIAMQSGIDYVVLGAVTTFGNERTHKRGGVLGIPFLGGGSKNKQESTIGLTLRVVDVRTGEIVATTVAAGAATKESRTLAGGALIKGIPIGGVFSSGGSGALDRLVASALVDAVDRVAEALATVAPRMSAGRSRF